MYTSKELPRLVPVDQDARHGEVQEISELLKVKSAELFGLLKTKHNTTTNSLSKDVEERNASSSTG